MSETNNDEITQRNIAAAESLFGCSLIKIPDSDIYMSKDEFDAMVKTIHPDPPTTALAKSIKPSSGVDNGGIIDYLQQNPGQLASVNQESSSLSNPITNLKLNQNSMQLNPLHLIGLCSVVPSMVVMMLGMLIISNNSSASQNALLRQQQSDDYAKLLEATKVVGQKRNITFCFLATCPRDEPTTPVRTQIPNTQPPTQQIPNYQPANYPPVNPVPNVNPAAVQYIHQWKNANVNNDEIKAFIDWLEVNKSTEYPPANELRIAYSQIIN